MTIRAEPGARISIGTNVEIGAGSTLAALAAGALIIERDVAIAHGCTIASRRSVRIKEATMLAEYVSIRDHDHDPALPPVGGPMLTGSVEIGAHSWLAAKVTVCRDAHVGTRSVVAANAVVTTKLPDRVLAAGVPARVIRTL